MRQADAPGQPVLRFTPTRVGNALFSIAPDPGLPVHPHAGGECGGGGGRGAEGKGSPPRGWGMHWRFPLCAHRRRFTPTRVGNAKSCVVASSDMAVHPHAGGECARAANRTPPATGSPPRGWGMRLLGAGLPSDNRFTPTRVGNALGKRTIARYSKVHPHAGGECLNSAK